VNLGDDWPDMLSHAHPPYPPALCDLLGQACAATQLFAAQIKFDGRLTLQLSGEGALRTLFAECTHDGKFRGIARIGGELPEHLDLREMGKDALLAVTIEGLPGQQGGGRYQGLVPMESETLTAALEAYFERSEQLPTRLLMAADAQRATGILLQQLPGTTNDPDAWNRLQALFETLGRDELLEVDGETLIHRLFHEEDPQLLGISDVGFGCSCSRERVEDMLQSLGEVEALAAIGEDGAVNVDCEFCGRHYRLERLEIAALFADSDATRH